MIGRFFKTVFILLRHGGTWVDGADWTDDDTIALGGFLASETGTKLRARLRNASLSMNSTAVQSSDMHRNGVACGYMLAVADLQSLSVKGAPQDAQTSEDAADTGDSNLEHLNP